MKVGDLVRVPIGTVTHWELKTDVGVLVAKLPRADVLEYDWKLFIDGRYLELGRQLEDSGEVLSESR